MACGDFSDSPLMILERRQAEVRTQAAVRFGGHLERELGRAMHDRVSRFVQERAMRLGALAFGGI